MKTRGGPSPCWLQCDHTWEGRRKQPREQLSLQERTQLMSDLRRNVGNSLSTFPMALFENSPASLHSYQEASCCCAKGLGQGVLSLERAGLCSQLGKCLGVVPSREAAQYPGPTQLSLEWVTGSPALLWHCPRTLGHRLCPKHRAVKKLLG